MFSVVSGGVKGRYEVSPWLFSLHMDEVFKVSTSTRQSNACRSGIVAGSGRDVAGIV